MTVADLIRNVNELSGAELPRLPGLLVAIAARMAEAESAPLPTSTNGTATLVDAAQAATALDVPESWLRSQARQGKLPSVRCGKYVRFDIAEVKRALCERETVA